MISSHLLDAADLPGSSRFVPRNLASQPAMLHQAACNQASWRAYLRAMNPRGAVADPAARLAPVLANSRAVVIFRGAFPDLFLKPLGGDSDTSWGAPAVAHWETFLPLRRAHAT